MRSISEEVIAYFWDYLTNFLSNKSNWFLSVFYQLSAEIADTAMVGLTYGRLLLCIRVHGARSKFT